MAQRIKRPFLLLLAMGGCLLPSLFVCLPAKADTIFLKNGKELKGLVVERHADRVILSTEKGEMPVFLKTIKNIKYDDRAQSFFQIGMAYEKEARLGEAMAYYLKALDENPDLPEVRSALQGVRSRFYASTTEGPREEMEKQQILHDSWTKSQPIGDLIQKRRQEHAKLLRDGLGLALEKKGDWVRLSYVDMTKPGALAGLKKNDRLVSIDGRSQRYLPPDAVLKTLLLPRYANFTLEFERDCFLRKEARKVRMKEFGLELHLKYEGIIVKKVAADSSAYRAGLRPKDVVVSVNTVSTRYLPLSQVIRLVEDSVEDRIVFTVRRNAILTRR